ncbi:MAG: condensation domain-containing protein, partial [Pseudomonadota bacterium]
AFLDQIETNEDVGSSTRLSAVFASGETLSADAVRRFYRATSQAATSPATTSSEGALGEARSAKDPTLFNLYGPTEATVDVTAHRSTGEETVVPIGAPIANVAVYVVDTHLQPQPIGVVGELLIGGVQVSRGYRDRPGLTAERFVADPFGGEPGARLYRTGDLARWRPDGTLEFWGRTDDQVKIRGMRVEPGEIEAALAACEGIAQAAVVARQTEDGDRKLLAYVVPSEGPEAPPDVCVIDLDGVIDLAAVRAGLTRQLPQHMIPAGFVGLSHLPLTASGKLDRNALPEADGAVSRAVYVAPRTASERHVAEAFTALLSTAAPSVHDNFFELGGHSLLATRLVARLAATTGRALSVRTVFEGPTVAELAAALEVSDWTAKGRIERADRTGRLPLSYQQERLWFLDRLDPRAGAAYHMVGAVRLSGRLEKPQLVAALRALVARHESLRTRFAVEDGVPVQVIEPASDFGVPTEDAVGLSEADLRARVDRLVSEPFDLERGPLFRAHLLGVSDEDHVLVLGGHHTVLDGWSVGLLLNELSALYRAAVTGTPADLPALPVQYADYAVWQRETLSAEALAGEIDWWRETLSGIPEAITLPTDRPRPAVMDYRGGSVPVHVPADVTAGLNALGRAHGATLFMVLEAAFAALLSRLGAGEDVVVGTAVAGRPRRELEDLAGFFVNTVALRNRIDPMASFTDHLLATKRVVMDAFEHQSAPFEAVVDALHPTRTLAHTPIIQTIIVLQNTPDAPTPLQLAELEVSRFDIFSGATKSELSLLLEETPEGLQGQLIYARQVFDRDTAERLANMFVRVLQAVFARPDTQLGDLPLLSPHERITVLENFNDAGSTEQKNAFAVERFVEHAATNPSAIAVIAGDRALSYSALDRASNRLARHLIGLGVSPEDVVAVCLGHSAELLLALLGARAKLLHAHWLEVRLHALKDAAVQRIERHPVHDETLGELPGVREGLLGRLLVQLRVTLQAEQHKGWQGLLRARAAERDTVA